MCTCDLTNDCIIASQLYCCSVLQFGYTLALQLLYTYGESVQPHNAVWGWCVTVYSHTVYGMYTIYGIASQVLYEDS